MKTGLSSTWPGSVAWRRVGSVYMLRTILATVSASSLRKMQLLRLLLILPRLSVPTSRGTRPVSPLGSGKTSAYCRLNLRAISRVISMWGIWSSPTGTRWALGRRMSAIWLTG